MSPLKFVPTIPSLECVQHLEGREIYHLPEHKNHQLVLETDHIGTHGITHTNIVPGKGEILTALKVFLAKHVLKELRNDLVAYGTTIHEYLPPGHYNKDIHLRGIVTMKLEKIPVRFTYRNRMAGKLWKKYYSNGEDPHGLMLPRDLKLMSPFDAAVFTPTQMIEEDAPLLTSEIERQYPEAFWLTRAAYLRGRAFALSRGIEIIDGRFGVATVNGTAILTGDYLTPDVSRYAEAELITIGEDPPHLDEQYLRDEAKAIWRLKKKGKHPLELNAIICAGIVHRYGKLAEHLMQTKMSDFQRSNML